MAEKSIKKIKDKEGKKISKKASSQKKLTTSPKKTSSSQKKDVTKKSTTKASTSAKTKTTKKTSSRSKSTAKTMLAEYYDLPYRYNETVVKILAQTPTTLFVYWDISDSDKTTLMEKHGKNMFYETKPILIVHNVTKNYSFEIEINDFANSWYIRTQEPDCDYIIELGRKFINKPDEYIYINTSNNIKSPNDHILFEKSDLGNVLFRNVKTNVLSSKDFGSLKFMNNIDKLYGNVYDIYNKLYKDELLMPTSGEFIHK